ncbi:MAG: inositol monophosphatase family protein [Chthoniobacterales bacterium]
MTTPYQQALQSARTAALAAGELLRKHAKDPNLIVDKIESHDIKLELDRRTQELIENILKEAFPNYAIYGEEGISGNPDSEYRWIIDPIDGTVNFFYGIPHFAISIALQRADKIVVGVIYDPMRNELWEAVRDGSVTLNGKPVHVSQRSSLSDAVLSIGMSKAATGIEEALPRLIEMMKKARKCRIMGSATLDIAYVATGRLDAYMEAEISLWDIAAGILMVEMAGGIVDLKPHATKPDKFSIVASSGNISEIGDGR